MRHWLLKLVVFLLLGAIVNVAVAWGFTVFGNSVGAEFVTMNGPDARAPTGLAKIQILRVGWPFHCLEGAQVYSVPHYGVPGMGTRIASESAISLQGSNAVLVPFAFGFLPIGPIGMAFVINTMFYGAFLWLVFAVLFALRRCRRIKRGLCPACAYPVGEAMRVPNAAR